MSRLWVKVIKKHKIVMHESVTCDWGECAVALREVCRQFDIPAPIWLGKHEREFDSFRRTAFLREHFIEEVSFDRLEIEYLADDGVTRRNDDPRNQF